MIVSRIITGMKKRTNKTPPLSLLSSLAEKSSEQLFTLLLPFIFSTALVGGCAYLLFHSRNERNNIDREILQFGILTQEDKHADEMGKVFRTGLFAENAQSLKLGNTINYLSSNIKVEKLEDTYAKDTLDWSTQSIARLSSEKGQIGGYTFSNELYKNLQHDELKAYEADVGLYRQINELIINWQKDSTDERRKYLAAIADKAIEEKVALSQIQTRSMQAIEQLQLKMKENEQQYNELKDKNRTWGIKSTLAIIGIAIGSAATLGILGLGIYSRSLKPKNFKSKSQGSNAIHKSRKKKSR
jgi:hypothetical protein